MGMSAGQARLLSVTARLTDNELRSQMLTNSKLRLADKSTEASNKYMDALNSQQLMYTSYDGSGNKLTEALTANTILTFADLKNQYAMVNTAGQVLVSGTDKINYQKSNTLNEFLECYGISKVDNPDYTSQIKEIYGNNYADFYDENNIYGLYNDTIMNTNGLLGYMNNFVTYDENTDTYSLNKDFLTSSDTNGDGINELIISSDYNTYCSELSNYINSSGYNNLSNGCVYKNVFNNALDIIKDVQTPTLPQKGQYPAEPLQSDYQKEYIDELYTETFMNAFNKYPGLFDENTGTFNVDMNAYTTTNLEIEDVLALLFLDNKGSLFTSFENYYLYLEPENRGDTFINQYYSFYKTLHNNKWSNGLYGADMTESGIQYSDFADLRNEIWENYDQRNPNDLQQAIIDAYYFTACVSDNVFSFLYDPLNPFTLKIEKDDADREHDKLILEQSKQYYLDVKAEYESHSSSNPWITYEYEKAQAVYQAAQDEMTKDFYEINPGSPVWYDSPIMAVEDYENPNVSYLFQKMVDNVIKEFKRNGHAPTVDDIDAYNAAYDEYEKEKERIDQEYAEAIKTYNTQLDQIIESFNQSLISAYQGFIESVNTYKIELDNILNNNKQIPDENDSKYQWYKNLWYRMGGISEKEKDDSGRHYKELDPNLLNNAEWLEFALEHGVITLEQAQFNKDGSVTYPNMGTYDWTSIIYTNAADIVSQEDEAAIARAEVEYENAVRDIQNEDKKIDQDLKKLDTEHSALQTEYDSIKSVIDKNVERSFKAFS